MTNVKNIKRPYGKIYYTKDYHKFDFIPRNRDIKKSHVKFLAYSHESPIENNGNKIPIVTKWSKDRMKLLIMEGQHRKEACQMTNTPLAYYIDEDMEESDIAPLNTTQKSWDFNDYLKFYNHEDNPTHKTYQFIATVKNDYPFLLSKSLLILLGGSNNSRAFNSSFKDGTFEIKSMKESLRIAEELKRIYENLDKKIKSYQFTVSYMGLRKEKLFSFNTALKQLVKYVDMYNEYSTIETYRRGMVAAYNFRLKKKEHLNPPMNDN